MSTRGRAPVRDHVAEQVLLSDGPVDSGSDSGIPGYNRLVLEHFRHPRHAGEFAAGPDILQGRAGTQAQGAEVAFSLLLEGDVVIEVRFRAFGCPHFLAAASLATEHLRGLRLPDLKSWQATWIGEQLGFPVEKRGRLLILEDAVRAAVQNHGLQEV